MKKIFLLLPHLVMNFTFAQNVNQMQVSWAQTSNVFNYTVYALPRVSGSFLLNTLEAPAGFCKLIGQSAVSNYKVFGCRGDSTCGGQPAAQVNRDGSITGFVQTNQDIGVLLEVACIRAQKYTLPRINGYLISGKDAYVGDHFCASLGMKRAEGYHYEKGCRDTVMCSSADAALLNERGEMIGTIASSKQGVLIEVSCVPK